MGHMHRMQTRFSLPVLVCDSVIEIEGISSGLRVIDTEKLGAVNRCQALGSGATRAFESYVGECADELHQDAVDRRVHVDRKTRCIRRSCFQRNLECERCTVATLMGW